MEWREDRDGITFGGTADEAGLVSYWDLKLKTGRVETPNGLEIDGLIPYENEVVDIGKMSNPFANGYFNNIYINGKSHGNAKVLWDNAFFMAGNPVQVATLTEAVSAQQHGIILVFSEYVNGAAANYSYQSFFVSKKEVEHRANVSHCFPLFGAEFAVTALKFLFIHDTKIVGDARNSTSGTKSGIAYDGKRFVMRTVYGI